MNLTETAGFTLQGAIDGANATYNTTYPMQMDYVAVYLNGRLKVASLADGYTIIDSFTVVLKEPPLVGDTVQVEYRTGSGFGGGADGGVPAAPLARNLAPQLAVASKGRPCAPAARVLAPQCAVTGKNGC